METYNLAKEIAVVQVYNSDSLSYHIYVHDFKGKIFEGRIGNASDFGVVMRVLGFEKTN